MKTKFNNELLGFINQSPTPFHATSQLVEQLKRCEFIALDETQAWSLKEHTGYFVTRNHSSLIAFTTGGGNGVEQGIRMVGAHTDSPCLKLKPQPEIRVASYQQWGVEVYGAALLAPWFDRDLSLAGRVSWLEGNQVRHTLIDFKRAIATIPSFGHSFG